MRNTKHQHGFTLIELLIALVVTSIILTAIATLAFALGSANDASDDTGRKQAQLRAATIRISELIRNCRMLCAAAGNDLAVWRADENGDRQININELVYIQRGPDSNYLRLCELAATETSPINLGGIQTLVPEDYSFTYVPLLPQCGNVRFNFDVSPPETRFISILFELTENDLARQYQINAALRAWAGNLLNNSSDTIVSDDD